MYFISIIFEIIFSKQLSKLRLNDLQSFYIEQLETAQNVIELEKLQPGKLPVMDAVYNGQFDVNFSMVIYSMVIYSMVNFNSGRYTTMCWTCTHTK